LKNFIQGGKMWIFDRFIPKIFPNRRRIKNGRQKKKKFKKILADFVNRQQLGYLKGKHFVQRNG